MSTDSLTMPIAGPSMSRGQVPAVLRLPLGCQGTAGQDAEFAEEDSIQQQSFGFQPAADPADTILQGTECVRQKKPSA
jgi:hypothetical protein